MPFVIIYAFICFIVALIFAEKNFTDIIYATFACFVCTPIFGIWVYNKMIR